MPELKPISYSVSKITRENFSRKFVSLSRILSQWDDVMGQDMAKKAQPVKLHYRKPKSAQDRPSATLDIAVSSADAVSLHYHKDLILERINQLFGEKWVTAIRFIHAPGEKNMPIAAQPKILTDEDEERLGLILLPVQDDEIKLRLERLGLSVLRKPHGI